MADRLPPLTPPDLDAPWLTDEDHGLIRRSMLRRSIAPGKVLLFDPDKEHLAFGASSSLEDQSGNIQFGDVEPHFALVNADHPALDVDDLHSLFRMERRIVVVARGDEEEPAPRPAPKPAARRTTRRTRKPAS